MLPDMRWFAPVLGFLAPAAAAATPPSTEAPAPAPTEAAPVAPTAPPDPEIVAWYQDMRLACVDRRAAIVARAQPQRGQEPGLLLGQTTWTAAAQAGAVSWGAATDPRVDDKALARTPEPADYHRQGAPAPQAVLEPDLPAEVLGRLRAIELCQGQADVAWRAWQAQPLPAERQALTEALVVLQGLCTGVEVRP
jgi:hypothetical protein